MTVGDKLREERKNMGLTLEQLSQLSGIKTMTLQAYETNRISNVPYKKLLILSNIFLKDPNYFLSNTTDLKEDQFSKNYNREIIATLLISTEAILSRLSNLEKTKRDELLAYISNFLKENI